MFNFKSNDLKAAKQPKGEEEEKIAEKEEEERKQQKRISQIYLACESGASSFTRLLGIAKQSTMYIASTKVIFFRFFNCFLSGHIFFGCWCALLQNAVRKLLLKEAQFPTDFDDALCHFCCCCSNFGEILKVEITAFTIFKCFCHNLAFFSLLLPFVWSTVMLFQFIHNYFTGTATHTAHIFTPVFIENNFCSNRKLGLCACNVHRLTLQFTFRIFVLQVQETIRCNFTIKKWTK